MTLPAFLLQAPPLVAVDIAPERVAVSRIERRGQGGALAASAIEPLPPGAVSGALGAPNMADVGLVAAAIGRAMDQAGGRAKRVSLVVPDSVARVSLIRFETVPTKAGDMDELVRWQVKKTTPFPLDEAIVAYTAGASTPGAHDFVVSVARRDVIEQFERACELAGAHAGLVDLATPSVVNAVLASTTGVAGDWLLIHATPTYVSVVVLRDGHPIFFRTRGDEAEGSVADLVHQTAMYYEDRLQGRSFSRALIAGVSSITAADELRRELSERLRLEVTAVEAVRSSVPGSRSRWAAAGDNLAPGIGILLRELAVA